MNCKALQGRTFALGPKIGAVQVPITSVTSRLVVVRGPISGARGAGKATQNQDNMFRKCPLHFRARGAFTTRELATSALKLCMAAPCDYRRGSQYFRVTRGVPPFPISSSSKACLILQLAVHWVMTVLRPLEH